MRRRRIWALLTAGVVATLVAVPAAAQDPAQGQPLAPSLVGLALPDAQAAAAAAGVPLQVRLRVHPYAAGKVIEQWPRAGEAVASADEGGVLTVVSTGMLPTGAAREFRTTGGAAYCQVDDDRDLGPHLYCWAPRNGWMIALPARGVGRAPVWTHRRAIGHRPAGFRTVGFGGSWRWRASYQIVGSPPTSFWAFNCYSNRTRLTCTNSNNDGFWVGRRGGTRVWSTGGL